MKWANPSFQCYFMWLKDSDIPSLPKGFSSAKLYVSSSFSTGSTAASSSLAFLPQCIPSRLMNFMFWWFGGLGLPFLLAVTSANLIDAYQLSWIYLEVKPVAHLKTTAFSLETWQQLHIRPEITTLPVFYSLFQHVILLQCPYEHILTE